jgi:protein SCO1
MNWRMKVVVTLCLVTFLASLTSGKASADHDPPQPLEQVAFDQKLNERIPLDLMFTDDTGRVIRLGDYFGNRPVILLLAYYECPQLCSLVLSDLTKSLQALAFDAGEQFEVVTVSIDPRETPELAAAKKAAYLQEYGRPAAASGWHFLTGEQAAIARLAEATGFRYVYDEALDQFAHPSGFIVLTPEGRISHYFFGLDYSPTDVRLGLVEASANQIGSVVDQFYLLCFAYDPVSGRYNLLITNVLRLAGLATVVALAGLVLALYVREKRDRVRQAQPAGESHG